MIVWRDVKGFEGWYQVSSNGIVKSLDRHIVDGRLIKGKTLHQYIDRQGYRKVSLCRSGKHYHYFVHRLVAETFIPNKYNLQSINHIDENPANNDVSNLEWCTTKYNVNYGNRAKKFSMKTSGELHYGHKLSEQDVLNIIKEYKPGVRGSGTESIAKKYGVHRMTIKAIITGQSWKYLTGGKINVT